MELRNNLYEVESVDKEMSRVTVRLKLDSVIYSAHFPGNPVTPGVCIIGMAVEAFGLLEGHTWRIDEVVNAKFLAVMSPASTPTAHFTFSRTVETPGGVKTSVLVTDTEGKALSKLTVRIVISDKRLKINDK